MPDLPPLVAAVAATLLMALGGGLAWWACGPRDAAWDVTTPGRLFVLFFMVTTGAGTLFITLTGQATGAGALLCGVGLLAFGIGAAAAARSGVPTGLGPPATVGVLRPLVVVGLALVGLVALASIARKAGLPLLTHDALGSRSAYQGLAFDLFGWLVPPAVLVAVGVALARPTRRAIVVAALAAGAVTVLMILVASRALPLGLAVAALLLAWWAGHRPRRRLWLTIGGAALALFVGVQLLRVTGPGFASGSDFGSFVVGRTIDRILLIQARTVELVAAEIPGSEPYFGGSTYLRWLAAVRGEAPPEALGFWIYDRLYPDQQGGFATPGILGELWANGGFLLVLPGMALFGLLAQLAGRLVARIGPGVADRVFAALLVLAFARTYATSLNGLILTLAVALAWRLAVTAPSMPGWLRRQSAESADANV